MDIHEDVPFRDWPSIRGLHYVKKDVEYLSSRPSDDGGRRIDSVHYKYKIKLHGSNAGVALAKNDKGVIVRAQSRNRPLTINDDMAGMAKQVDSTTAYWAGVYQSLTDKYPNAANPVVFGEWAGPGVQPNVALSRLEDKIFAVFAIDLDGEEVIVDPAAIAAVLLVDKAPKYVHVLPWMSTETCGERIRLDFAAGEEALDKVLVNVNRMVEDIDHCDPWVEDVFGVRGPGEGCVWYPYIGDVSDETFSETISRDDFALLSFKTKGASHAVVKQKKPAQSKPERVEGVDEFVTLVVTEERLRQGLSLLECDGPISKKLTGKFVQWVCADVQKECALEMEASQLTWAMVKNTVMNASRSWFFNQCE